MISNLFSLCILTFLLIVTRLSTSFSNGPELYANCSKLFQCANVENIGYPFWGGARSPYCGHQDFELNCDNKENPQITIKSSTYRVLSINSTTNSITLVRSDFQDSLCLHPLSNDTINTPYLTYSSSSVNITFYYGCPGLHNIFQNQFHCGIGDSNLTSYYCPSHNFKFDFGKCDGNVFVHLNRTSAEALSSNPPSMNISTALRSGFELVWDVNESKCDRCTLSGGVCGSNMSVESFPFLCFCSDQPYKVSCGDNGNGTCPSKSYSWRKKSSNRIIIGIVAAVVGSLVLGFAIFGCKKMRKRTVAESSEFGETKPEDIPFAHLTKSLTSTNSSSSLSRFPSSRYNSGTASTYFGVQVFDYIELEKATDNFNPSREIGDGGFGTVFYGKLDDSREVAVKRLYENNFKRVRQFMNEIEILTRLSHTNLVKLYGCTSRRSRELLLVYEYIPNGTVADHLHGDKSKLGLLSWPIRLSIAIETAEALTYLHKSDIIHRDVKTTNILLDNDFRVKVADFGLSRLFPNNVTHVSTAPQGTPGYVDPEYHQCYHLTEKSDVYSLGVVLVELISSKQAVDISRHRHDINLSNMALNKIQNGELHELVDTSLGYEKNKSIKRMITSVAEIAFRCLQNESDMRPTMQELLEGLKKIKNNEDLNGAKVEVTEVIIGYDTGLSKNNSPPISPNSVIANKWISNATTPNTSR